MLRRATTTIRVDDTLVLRPATEEYSEALLEAFEETWPEVSRAMPWINPDMPFDSQMQDFLIETEGMGRSGMLHHWIMVRPWDDALLGLIGFDRVTVRDWKGERCIDGDSAITVAGVRTKHECHLIRTSPSLDRDDSLGTTH